MMARCVELMREATRKGEYPFGALIALDGHIVAEAINCTVGENDVSRHAEVIALAAAQKQVGRQALVRATLYSAVEPCAMCAYCIREAWIGRVVYALGSPIMGGLSKWNILRDEDLSGCIPIFGPPPEVVCGAQLASVCKAWRDWNPLAWELVRLRGVLVNPDSEKERVRVFERRKRTPWHHLLFAYTRLGSRRAKDAHAPSSPGSMETHPWTPPQV